MNGKCAETLTMRLLLQYPTVNLNGDDDILNQAFYAAFYATLFTSMFLSTLRRCCFRTCQTCLFCDTVCCDS